MSTALPSLLKALHAPVTAPCVTLITYVRIGPGMRHFKRLDKTFDSLRLVGQTIIASPLDPTKESRDGAV